MKRIFQIASVFCTLFLLELGANMPYLTSLFLDYQLEKEVIQRQDAYVSLNLEQEKNFFQTLELFYSKYSRIDLPEGYEMTTEEAKFTAANTLSKLELFDDMGTVVEVTPVLFTNKDSSLSGVYWCCVSGILDENSSINVRAILWLDDESGKMVGLQSRINMSDLNFALNQGFYGMANKIAEYCRLYYPVDTATLVFESEEEDNNSYMKIKEEQEYIDTTMIEYANGCSLVLTQNKDGQAQSYTISINLLQDGWLHFNI